MRRGTAVTLLLVAMVTGLLAKGAAHAAELSDGQTIYVPAYSSIYFGDRQRQMNLAVTLCLRNTDTAFSVAVGKVTYHDEKGALVNVLVGDPVTLAPLETRSIVIKESDTTGGVGSSFLIEWRAEKPVSPLIAEAVMIGAKAQQGVSFATRGVVLREAGQ